MDLSLKNEVVDLIQDGQDSQTSSIPPEITKSNGLIAVKQAKQSHCNAEKTDKFEKMKWCLAILVLHQLPSNWLEPTMS